MSVINSVKAGERMVSVAQAKAAGHGAKSVKPGSDRVQVTDQQGTVAALVAQAAELPATRAARVAQLKAQIENGTYAVDADAVAARLMEQGRY